MGQDWGVWVYHVPGARAAANLENILLSKPLVLGTGGWVPFVVAVSSDFFSKLFFLRVLLRYHWQTAPCEFKVYSIMIWLIYIMKWSPRLLSLLLFPAGLKARGGGGEINPHSLTWRISLWTKLPQRNMGQVNTVDSCGKPGSPR